MTAWEYCKLDLIDARRVQAIDVLNDLGRQGWELVALTVNNVAYLKRAVADPSTTGNEASGSRRAKSGAVRS